MISSDNSCQQLVAGNYDVIINDTISSCRHVISKYLERFKNLESQLGQPECGYYSEFKLLKEISKNLRENKANLQDGEMEYNQRKNRYKDIIPFGHTRVILSSNPDGHGEGDAHDPGSNYINANYISGPSGSDRAYIACQGPLQCTLNDFWRMIWECNVSVIIMACNEIESDKPKCELYWPGQVETSQIYGNIQVTLMRVRQLNSDFLIRKFSIKLLEPIPSKDSSRSRTDHQRLNQQQQQQQVINNNNNNNDYGVVTNIYDEDRLKQQYNQFNNSDHHHHRHLPNGSICTSSTSNESINTDDQNLNLSNRSMPGPKSASPSTGTQSNRAVLAERTICQFHYTTWPDHGVPDSVGPILELVRLVREVQPAEDKPILVHCSAGCGRTGTICCIDYVWGLLRRGKLDSSFDLHTIISNMRQQRMAMVQTLEQYILCHRAVAALFMQQLHLLGQGVFDDSGQEEEDELKSENYLCGERQDADLVAGGEVDEDDDEEEDLGPVFI